MVGGRIVQKVGDTVEVLDDSGNSFDRCWRKLERPGEVRVGDGLWWMSHTGYVSRPGERDDFNIGGCVACNPHGRESKVEMNP